MSNFFDQLNSLAVTPDVEDDDVYDADETSFDDEDIDYETLLTVEPHEVGLNFRNTYVTVSNPGNWNTVQELVTAYGDQLSLDPSAVKKLYVSINGMTVSLDNVIVPGTIYDLSLDQQKNGN